MAKTTNNRKNIDKTKAPAAILVKWKGSAATKSLGTTALWCHLLCCGWNECHWK